MFCSAKHLPIAPRVNHCFLPLPVARSVMAGVFLKRDFYLSIIFARRMKKNKHEFLACARHARLPLQIYFLLSQPSPSPHKIGGEFSYVPHFFFGNIFRRFFAQNHRLCEGCESEKIKIPVMRARVTRARGFAKPFLCGLFLGLSHLCEKISESFPKNSHVFQKISNVFQKISDVFQRISDV